ncbi:hypothetical protein HMPREF9120_01835 [Neisseria sp. oral taxon 020 str. F0370]|nr:hypothetical protein HMPREF9120_01835 [Neisseria sp. oral taxon 020 str. F0370]
MKLKPRNTVLPTQKQRTYSRALQISAYDAQLVETRVRLRHIPHLTRRICVICVLFCDTAFQKRHSRTVLAGTASPRQTP